MARTLAALLVLATAAPLPASDIDTATLTALTGTAAPACARYTPIGLCVWLTCTPVGCVVATSLKVGHYNPDLVVSAYHEVGANPWVEMRATLGAAARAAGQGLLGALLGVELGEGDRSEGTVTRDHQNLRFKEADAIGHPVAALTDVLSVAGLTCPSETVPLLPYFQSTLDVLAWRTELPESLFPAAWLPGSREIGHWPRNTWGAVYPRSGFVTQAEDPKAGAVAAQRAGDIVTRTGQPHVYLPVTTGQATRRAGSLLVFSPPPLRETDAATGWWQRLTPVPTTDCEVFGHDDTAEVLSWADFKSDAHGDYAWSLWRPYRCCPVAGAELIGSIDLEPFP